MAGARHGASATLSQLDVFVYKRYIILMSDTIVVTSRVPRVLSEGLDSLAKDMDRTRAWIVATAIRRYVEEQSEWIAFIKEGEDDIAAGRTFTQEEVEAMFLNRRKSRAAA